MNMAQMLDREAVALYGGVARKRGRPVGSKNRKSRRKIASDREAQMIVMRESSATLEEIGAEFGITRERARQLLARNGYRGLTRSIVGIDPLAIMRAVRERHMTSVPAVAKAVGSDFHAVQKTIAQLGLRVAVQRLFRWRRASASRRRIVAQLQSFTATHGRAPTYAELGMSQGKPRHPDAPVASNWPRLFGSYQAAFEAAGLTLRPVGGPGHVAGRRDACRRGHLRSPENTYTWTGPDGVERQFCRACKRIGRSPRGAA